MTNGNYVSRQAKLLKDFDRSVVRAKHILTSRYGEGQANTLMREAHQEYEALIPQIPYIGDKTPLLRFLLPTSRYLAVYRALQKQGGTIEDAGQLIREMSKAELKAIPRLVRRAIGYLWFSSWFSRRLKKLAKKSHEREYSGDFVFNYMEGDGQTFDFGIDYSECASCKFLSAQGAMELLPYICAIDKDASEMLGWGMSRTMTLAEGSERCDFRFKKGGMTNVHQSLKAVETARQRHEA